MSDSTTTPARLLIVDDQRDVLEALRLLFKPEGFKVDPVQSPAAALEALEGTDYDAVLTDLNFTRDTTSGEEGLDLVQRIQAIDADLPIIVMTAWASVDVAVEAMRRGARDFVEKPWDNRRLLSIVRNQVELGRALTRSKRLEAENDLLRDSDPDFISESPAMREVVDLVRRVARADVAVLITGEAGTGKGMVARLLHRHSSRAGQPMISVNMGSVPEAVYESEMFGHVKGAFTDASADRTGRFELADRGTLFLDEIGNVPIGQQAKLLRVLETGEYEPVGSSRTRTGRRAPDQRHQRRSGRAQRIGCVPQGPAVPDQHRRDPAAAAAQATRGHPAAGAPGPGSTVGALSRHAG
jgi:DNA-binding NtrC family response regulator